MREIRECKHCFTRIYDGHSSFCDRCLDSFTKGLASGILCTIFGWVLGGMPGALTGGAVGVVLGFVMA